MNLEHDIEEGLIRHCSPTLAALKTAALFTVEQPSGSELSETLGRWNVRLLKKGVVMIKLCERNNRALIYVFRVKRLAGELACPRVRSFLAENGYDIGSRGVSGALSALRSRLAAEDGFPHEIGVFLGYPIDDVIGFIRNNGRNCKACGCWKVYCDECAAQKTFARFRKCEDVYMRLWKRGRSVIQLTVTA